MTHLIFGCGYLGSRVAYQWRQSGQNVRIVTRGAAKKAALDEQGYEGRIAAILDPSTLAEELFEGVQTILFAVGFDRQSGTTIQDVYVRGLANVLAACPPTIRQFIYISSTGVYGKGTGEWIDEHTTPTPGRDGGRACLEAEKLLLSSSFADRALVLRLAGIYGPERIPRMSDIIAGQPINALALSWLNLIHVSDAAEIIVQATRERVVGDLFNVSDGNPVQRREFYCELASLLDQPTPEFIEPTPEEAALTRGGDKRISNQRLVDRLQPKLQFPSYREGLANIVKTLP